MVEMPDFKKGTIEACAFPTNKHDSRITAISSGDLYCIMMNAKLKQTPTN